MPFLFVVQKSNEVFSHMCFFQSSKKKSFFLQMFLPNSKIRIFQKTKFFFFSHVIFLNLLTRLSPPPPLTHTDTLKTIKCGRLLEKTTWVWGLEGEKCQSRCAVKVHILFFFPSKECLTHIGGGLTHSGVGFQKKWIIFFSKSYKFGSLNISLTNKLGKFG